MILLDSSVLIELFRKKNNKENTLFYEIAKSEKEFSISTITYYEIGIGNRETHNEYWEELCENLMIMPFDKSCADNAISIYLDLLQNNKLIDIADILIAATALAHNIPIATLNVKHFEHIKRLEIIK